MLQCCSARTMMSQSVTLHFQSTCALGKLELREASAFCVVFEAEAHIKARRWGFIHHHSTRSEAGEQEKGGKKRCCCIVLRSAAYYSLAVLILQHFARCGVIFCPLCWDLSERRSHFPCHASGPISRIPNLFFPFLLLRLLRVC